MFFLFHSRADVRCNFGSDILFWGLLFLCLFDLHCRDCFLFLFVLLIFHSEAVAFAKLRGCALIREWLAMQHSSLWMNHKQKYVSSSIRRFRLLA